MDHEDEKGGLPPGTAEEEEKGASQNRMDQGMIADVEGLRQKPRVPFPDGQSVGREDDISQDMGDDEDGKDRQTHTGEPARESG